uniref:A to I editase domain-containing protein n=1 Tax=Anopheles atroparvus TaxID=41427 RepID=A0AAG5DUR4_ANOAO
MNSSATSSSNNKINISNNNNAINNKNNTSYTSSGAACHGMPSATSRRGTKRKVSAGTISSAVRKRRKLQHSSKPGESRQEQVPQTKNTVAVLNELKRNLVYKVESQTGPVHAPLFTISVVVDGQKFVGSGPSKKLARVAAAASALRSFIQFKDGATLTPIEPLHNVDFTSDDPMIENSIFPLSDAGPGIQEKIITSSGPALPENITVNSNNTNSYSTSNSNISNNNCNSSSVYSNNSSSCKGNAKSIASSRQCDVGGLNSVTHSLNSSSNSVKVSAASNREPVANVRTEAGVGQDKQPPPQAPPKLLSVVPSLSSSSSASTSLPSSSLASSSSSSSASSLSPVAPDKQAAGCVDTSARTIAPAAASSIVTNKLKVSAGNLSRTSGNVIAGHHPKPQPEKGPVMLLHELFTDAHFECVSSDGLQHSKFTVVVTVNDNQRFEGTGPSKKMAKNAAAKAALASICNISFSPLQQSKFGLITSGASNGSIGGSNSVSVNGDNSFKQNKNFELPQTFADAVGKLVIEKFNEVMKGSDVYSRRKVLAGFVMTHGYDVKTAKVISLATGTKCVSGEHMSVTGSVINDSHAEIIARRGLMDFFYSQLDLLCQQTTSSAAVLTTTAVGGGLSAPPGAVVGTLSNGTTTAITSVTQSGDVADVEAVSEQKLATATPQAEVIFNKPSNESSLYTLKEGIYFHLYINTAPCGDARVFSPHENDSMDVDKHPNRKARGQLRTKVESGEGTIPVKSSDGIQTWDGVLQGQRLLTMSCSDKISRWNVLGLQGSMLASVIEPIYLHSIVLGSLLHPAHMYRAICGRIENAIQGLPPPYRLNKPKLALMTSAESRNQTKPPNFSINWITNSMEVEIVNSFTGKLINNNTNTNKMSRLSKQSFYRRYASIIARLPSVRLRHVKPTYFETKMSVNEYQQAKRELFAAFSKEDLGDWLKKPIEQDQFTLIVAKDSEPPSHVSQPQTVPTTSELNSLVSNAASTVGNCSK